MIEKRLTPLANEANSANMAKKKTTTNFHVKCPNCGGSGRVPDSKKQGEELIAHRKSKNLSARKVALAMKISPPYLCDLEKGHREWSRDLIKRFRDSVRQLSSKKR